MKNVPDLREIFDPPNEIVEAGLNGQLVLFVGAGASRLLGLPSWSGLAERLLNELRENEYINFSEIEQLRSLDPKKQLSIACLIAENHNYKFEFAKHLTTEKQGELYKAINEIGCPCVTTNYDELITPRHVETKDGSVKEATVVRVSEKEKFFANLLNEPGTVVHLHGSISNPNTMIITTKQYLEHYDDKNVQDFLDELFQKKTVLFLGYGLEENEILEYLLRSGSASPTHDRKRFVLQGFFLREHTLYENLHHYYKQSFGVYLLGFVRDYNDYNQLEVIIKSWLSQIKVKRQPLSFDLEFMNEVLGNE